MSRLNSAAEVIAKIEPGHRVFVHGAAATPHALLSALVDRSSQLKDVELIHLHTEGPAPYAEERYRDAFKVVSLFVGANLRDRLNYGRIDYLPCFLSEIPALFRSGQRPIDVAMLQLSPPDRHGYCSLGTSVDVARAAFESARIVIAQINPRMPRVHGDGFIPLSRVDAWVEIDSPLAESVRRTPSPVETAIGTHTAALIEDGACLQVGIGSIPDAVLNALAGHRHLGVHTEMWSDGMLELLRRGAVDNSRKKVHPGKSVSSFLMGSRDLYEYVHDNPAVVQLGIDYVNNPNIIARNPGVTAINSAVEVDLTGQICADSVGHRIISGVGGQMDFMRGATLSEGGKPIIAITSRTGHGQSRIVSTLKPGAGVVTTRAHVRFVVTEHGVADLYGKTLHERARALTSIAHPEDRERLEREWLNIEKCSISTV